MGKVTAWTDRKLNKNNEKHTTKYIKRSNNQK